eukprot:gnl/TRDRNA2_/TRDRNA2_171955_c5_seq28.p1 gnl/TRDRNA2_/TRDRNA2_171955_c5~~gnl/TRDRNA2_/TRDRNA2_171955_c5_seq28.p1  ORF type:complete len:360 (-),score=65.28 gnl/TRDRNA2_/TRDRNA2_171955_c5_seq28:61-1140(-)
MTRWDQSFPASDLISSILLVVPIISGALIAVTRTQRYMQKWAILFTASRELVAEIYKFRAGVLHYAPSAVGGDGSAEDEKDNTGAAPAGSPREVFTQMYQDVYRFVIENVGEDSIKEGSEPKWDTAESREAYIKVIRRYVKERLLPNGILAKTTSKQQEVNPKKKISPSKVAPEPMEGATAVVPMTTDDDDDDEDASSDGIVGDDFVGPILIETYIEHRLRPALRSAVSRSPGLAGALSRYELLAIVVASTGTLLAAINLATWVALTVTLGSTVTNVVQHKLLRPQLSSYNTAIRNLKGMQNMMDSLSVVNRRTRAVKGLCVGTVEDALILPVFSQTDMSALPMKAGGGGDEGEEGEKK